jgi:hypothetical protein
LWQALFLHRDTRIGEELAGSYRYQLHLYDWMESNDYGRSLADDRYI